MYTTSSHFQTWRRDVNLQPPQKTFSSSILDSIYRTIDDDDTDITLRRRRPAPLNSIREDPTPFRRSAVADKWLQRYQIQEKKKKNAEEILQKNQKHKDRQKVKQSLETEEPLKRTKSKTMKVYDQLKKAKYPISPGRRISTFLNSLFHSTTPRSSSALNRAPAAMGVGLSIKTRSTCNSLNVPRPCLSKTPGGGDRVKKSVRFSPRCVRKWEEEEKEDDSGSEDAYSCGSSDLFELENLIGVGGRYREELPVYETTTTSRFLL